MVVFELLWLEKITSMRNPKNVLELMAGSFRGLIATRQKQIEWNITSATRTLPPTHSRAQRWPKLGDKQHFLSPEPNWRKFAPSGNTGRTVLTSKSKQVFYGWGNGWENNVFEITLVFRLSIFRIFVVCSVTEVSRQFLIRLRVVLISTFAAMFQIFQDFKIL